METFLSILGWLQHAPEDFWSADRFWRGAELWPTWWEAKAVMQGVCFLCIFFFPRNVPVWTLATRWMAAIGSLIIFMTLFNQGLGWIGDLVFALGFMLVCLTQAHNGLVEKERERRAERMRGLPGHGRLLYLAITGQLPKSR